MKQCKEHGEKINIDNYCDDCGKKLVEEKSLKLKKCSQCKTTAGLNKKFCWSCGHEHGKPVPWYKKSIL